MYEAVDIRNQVQAYFCLFLFLFSEDLDRYWEDAQKLDKNVRPPPLFYKVNIFVIFVLKNTSKVITFYIIYILMVQIVVLV